MTASLAATFLREGWGERCDEEQPPRKSAEVPPVDPEPAALPRVHAHARGAPAGPRPECLWCQAPYTA